MKTSRKASEQTSRSRRKFLKQAAAGAAVLALPRWTAKSYAQIAGANDAVRHAVIGCNDCGRAHIRQFLPLSGVRLVGLCDVDTAVLDKGKAIVAASGIAADPVMYADYRGVLDNKEIDTVSVATPNHWHALMTIAACQAGKDVYIEKPTCHNIWEGQQALLARTKYNRIVQAGTQWRSMPQVQQAMAFAKSGKLGKILVSRGFCYKRRASIGKTDGPQPVPATVDYNLWCGPAPLDPPRRKQFHYDWHWFWETGNGDIGNQGAHQMDLARWALDKSTVAPTVISVGGRFGYVDDGQTPNTLMTVHDYGDALLIFEVRGLPAKTDAKQMDVYKGADVGNVIECEGGYVSISTRQCAAYDNDGKQIQQFSSNGVQAESAHKENFIEVARSRKREDQAGELVEGFLSSSLSHISNISYELGKQSDPDAIKAALGTQPAVADTFSRFQAHLDANGIQLDTDKAILGVPLQTDPQKFKIIGNDAASAMLTREYRAPFIVPDSV
jgi:predicted dehydrogenase